jgi:hypothetical protein
MYYDDNQRRLLEFKVEDQVLLKLAPWKNIIRFGIKGKLTPIYIKQFEIIERVGSIAYRLMLPSYLARIHNVFHVLSFRKAKIDLTLLFPQIPIKINEYLMIKVKPLSISIEEKRN